MRAKGPTFLLLDGSYWAEPDNSVFRERVSGSSSGVQLMAGTDPGNPLLLRSGDGSMGRLGVPRGIAVNSVGDIFLLHTQSQGIKRLDEHSGTFIQLVTVGGKGSEPRRFQDAANIAIAGRNLYVADRGNKRVQAFALPGLALRHVWTIDDPVDVTSDGYFAYLLDGLNGSVWRHRPGTDELVLILRSPCDAGKWSRLLVDSTGLLYLLDEATDTASVYTAAGQLRQTVSDASEIRDRFLPPPSITTSPEGFLHLPGGRFFDRRGNRVIPDLTAPLGPHTYALSGTWISKVLDSEVYRCQWHRLDIEADLPPGSRLVVSTFTHAELLTHEQLLSTTLDWRTRFVAVSPLEEEDGPAESREFLIQSREGRYLWVRLELQSDGYATPTVRRMRIHYPRDSYLKYLPAVYSSDEEGRSFLESYLSVIQTEWENIEARSENIRSYFDPKAVPEGPFLDWLSHWLSVPLESSWTYDKKRQVLEAAIQLYPRFGTIHGIRRFLQAFLHALSGEKESRGNSGFPFIIEGFCERRSMISLSASPLGREGSGSPMWSTGVVSRLQLGEFAREGEARLISAGDPARDFFHTFAHRFKVFVPAGYVNTQDDERMLRRVIETVKPAHTAYDLCFVAGRFRVGLQSSVGLDTVVGDYRATRLAQVDNNGSEVTDGGALKAGSLPPRMRLGYDTVLADGAASDAGFRIRRPGVRVGIATALR